MLFRILIPLLICGVLALACGSSPMHEPSDNSNLTAFDTADAVPGCDEAEQIAIVVSGELTAPWELRERVRADLQVIRSGWIDSVPQVAFEFSRAMSIISVAVDSTTLSAIQDGSYAAWDSLNELYMLDSIHTHHPTHPKQFTMHFADCQNPVQLALAYRALAGFVDAQSIMFWAGGMDLLFVNEVADTLFFFFRNDGGDPVHDVDGGMTYDIFSTFGGDIQYHGHFVGWDHLPEPWDSLMEDAWDLWTGQDAWPIHLDTGGLVDVRAG
ncbi:MAG: hypothetical protein ABIE70_10745 [bacterium]